eukprot:TRINITY_DN10253_c0_g1_i4.p1 TRINITY_DN10253_c0_g1~~TRINITY_DN10253_c0_g1_i4.p1  ORF type:complete len:237 (+),score=20.56 TRINITY_DN10253_c0_g1_i4:129-839(+)
MAESHVVMQVMDKAEAIAKEREEKLNQEIARLYKELEAIEFMEGAHAGLSEGRRQFRLNQCEQKIAEAKSALDKLRSGEYVAVKMGRNSINRLDMKRLVDEGIQDHEKRKRNKQSYENMSHLTKGNENISCTAGKLSPNDYEKVMQGLGPLITHNWNSDVKDLVDMVPDNNHIQTLGDLFSEARGKGITNLCCFSVENTQQFFLLGPHTKLTLIAGTVPPFRSAQPGQTGSFTRAT